EAEAEQENDPYVTVPLAGYDGVTKDVRALPASRWRASAFRALPDITIGADTSEADSDLQALRARMETLAGKRIGVDIDT
ncbi:hypothetical protein KBZ21_42610, partial [Streptomyces sp. A73]|nr:hypothetical protein [Streptomyces sp. A73]